MKNVGFIFIIIALVFAGGIYSARTMNQEKYPSIDVPYLSFQVQYPGATPNQSLEDIGKPLEEQLSKIKNLQNLYVTSSANNVNVMIEFSLSASMDQAESDVNGAISKVKLPDTAKTMPLQRKGPSAQPVYLFAVDGGGASIDDVQAFTDSTIKPTLQSVQGIADIEIDGVSAKKVFIKVDPEKLKQQNLTLDKVKQALLANNVTAPTGEVTMNDKTMLVQVGKQYSNIDEIKASPVIVTQQNTSGLQDAFTNIGQGMNTLGSAVGGLGKTVGINSKQQELMQQEIQLSGAITQLSGQIQADKVQLQALQSQAATTSAQAKANPTNPQLAKASSDLATQMNQLNQKMAGEEAKLTELQNSMTQLQAAITSLSSTSQQSLQSVQQSGSQTTPSSNSSVSMGGLTVRSFPLSDVADVTYANEQQSTITRLNGHPAISVGIIPNTDANTVDIVKKTNDQLAKISMPKGYSFTTLRDESKEIQQSVNSMMREALFGALLAAVVTLLFLRNIRTTIIAILSIPLSIFITLILLKQMGYTLNMMTLAGIAVAVGRVVDDSIVVIENLYRRIRNAGEEERTQNLIMEATGEVSHAISSSTITTVAVFIPLAFVPGIVGKFFAPFAWSVVISISFSLLVAVTVIPVLSRLTLLNMKSSENKNSWLEHAYRIALQWSLRREWIVVGISLLLLVGSGLLASKIPVNFFPTEATKYYNASVTMPIGTSIDKTNEAATKLEKIIADTKQVDNYETVVNGATVSTQITLKDNVDTKSFERAVRDNTEQLGKDIMTTLTATGSSPGGGGLAMIITGPDAKTISAAAADYEATIKKVSGIANVKSNVKAVRPQISVSVDNAKAADKGVYPASVSGAIRDMLSGSTISTMPLDGKTTDINLGLKTDALQSTDAIAAQKVTGMTGEDVTIGDIAKVEQTTGPTSVQRLNKADYVSISGTFTSDNSRQVQTDIKNAVAKVSVPPGVSYSFEGEAKQINEGFSNMFAAIGISIILVYVIMMITFGEMLAPFAIMFSLPFIFVGVVLGLFMTGQSLGMPALVGILMLIGIVVTNAIVLVDRVKHNEASGMSTYDALMEAGMKRIRPILMTAVATVGALTPLALSSEGGLISKSLAVTVISGLTTSTILTLVIVPIMYLAFHNLRARMFGDKK